MGKAALAGIGLLLSLAAVIWGCVFLMDYGGDARETKIRLEIETARAAQLEKSQKDVIDGIKNLQAVEDAIRAAPDNRPIGPVLRDQLVRMQRDKD